MDGPALDTGTLDNKTRCTGLILIATGVLDNVGLREWTGLP